MARRPPTAPAEAAVVEAAVVEAAAVEAEAAVAVVVARPSGSGRRRRPAERRR